ncbi:MAG: ParB/RepB/Spo0J family partition protein [Henriciella sp.]|nr:ParB/RepB/Spo0J family partition protein [Henriciella sp.]
MTTVSFDPDLLSAVHHHGPDGKPTEIAASAGIARNNYARAVKTARTNKFIEPDRLVLTPLGARLAGIETLPGSRETTLRLDQIQKSDLNPRRSFDEGKLAELADALHAQGQLQNILVRPIADGGDLYEIVIGERRFRAMTLLAEDGRWAKDAPVKVEIRTLSDIEFLDIAIMENNQREDIHPLEEADAIARLQDLRRAEGETGKEICGEIGERLGHTTRWAQQRVQIARDLSPACRQAYAEGGFTNFKTALLLSRHDHATQDDALVAITRGWNPLNTVGKVEDFLDRKAAPVGKQPFGLQDYLDRGGRLIEPEEEDEPQRFADRGLAETLTEEWIQAELETLTDKHGLQADPIRASYWNDWDYTKATKKTPRALCRAFIEHDQNTLATKIRAPIVEKAALERYKRAEEAKAAKAALAEKTGASEKDTATPLSRSQYKAGAEARTRALQSTIAELPHVAIALAVIGLLPRQNAGYGNSLCRIRSDWPTGEAGQIGFGNQLEALLSDTPIKGISPKGEITDRATALNSLLTASDKLLPQRLFAAMIADRLIDCDDQARAGSNDEAVILAKAGLIEDPGGAMVDAAHAKRYTRAQQSAAIDAYNLPLDTVAHAERKKGEADKVFAEAWPKDETPLEARFLDTASVRKLEAKLLARKPI